MSGASGCDGHEPLVERAGYTRFNTVHSWWKFYIQSLRSSRNLAQLRVKYT
jgi:hypothetical protein